VLNRAEESEASDFLVDGELENRRPDSFPVDFPE
jgi:hypothetical protein